MLLGAVVRTTKTFLIACPPSQYLKIMGRKNKNRYCKSLSLNNNEDHNFNLSHVTVPLVGLCL
jgi:hypothetical protein